MFENKYSQSKPATSSSAKYLIAYFYSGWAFLIPYLVTYLLYAWRKWPANPSTSHIPCLLHVYLFLHALHLILAVVALVHWWGSGNYAGKNNDADPLQKNTALDHLWPVVPWLLLGLIFWIPGVYLEWPSDPWEHLRRITEWSTHPIVGGHSASYKSFYFFAYSLIHVPPDLSRFGNVNAYGTCVDLLLAWQYFRLGKAVGLNEKLAFLFVLVNALTFGNVCFSFYKYYTLASTMYSQLGAVAIIRLTIEFFQNAGINGSTNFRSEWMPRSLIGHAIPAVLLSLIVACNHIQGLGIAGLGGVSIIIWWLSQRNRSIALWLIGVTLALSVATILWWPRQQAVELIYRPGGWLNFFYGFNIIAWPSPAADRAAQIVGLFGFLNFLSGILLLRRQSVVGYITVFPPLALMMPFVALPIANRLSATNVSEIISFHRLFFAIPSGLGAVFLARLIAQHYLAGRDSAVGKFVQYGAPVGILALLIVPPQGPFNNRGWNILSIIPKDLSLGQLVETHIPSQISNRDAHPHIVAANDLLATATTALFQLQSPNNHRSNNQPISQYTQEIIQSLSTHRKNSEIPDETIGQIRRWQIGVPSEGNHEIGWIRDANERTFSSLQTGWTLEAGIAPNFIKSGLKTTIIETSPGATSYVFTSDFIGVNSLRRFELQMKVRQLHSSTATAYLAVAWYNDKYQFLESDAASPKGAGNPRGWVNGIYSYFGLAATQVPLSWTAYHVSFGLGDAAAIPSAARFFKVGALLNFNGSPSAVVQLTDVRLLEKKEPIYIATWSWNSLASPGSLAARLSGHWPVQQVALGLACSQELDQEADRITKLTAAVDNEARSRSGRVP